MKLDYFNCPYIIKKFENHGVVKDRVLDYINTQSGLMIQSDTTNIRSDWGSYRKNARKYWSIIEFDIQLHLQEVFCDILGYTNFSTGNYWYQQYTRNGSHGWHTHLNTMWTCVYYLEMPQDAPKTECIDPFTKQIVKIEANEGDILTFPSIIIHRAPKVETECRKTILSWHCETSFSNDKNYY